MTKDEYFRSLQHFTVTHMPTMSYAEMSEGLLKLLSHLIVSGARGHNDAAEALLEGVRHSLDIQVGKALKDYALS